MLSSVAEKCQVKSPVYSALHNTLHNTCYVMLCDKYDLIHYGSMEPKSVQVE